MHGEHPSARGEPPEQHRVAQSPTTTPGCANQSPTAPHPPGNPCSDEAKKGSSGAQMLPQQFLQPGNEDIWLRKSMF